MSAIENITKKIKLVKNQFYLAYTKIVALNTFYILD